MDDYTIQETICVLLEGAPIDETDLADSVREVISYDEGGYLTYDKGLVLTTADGSEFQITIRQTR